MVEMRNACKIMTRNRDGRNANALPHDNVCPPPHPVEDWEVSPDFITVNNMTFPHTYQIIFDAELAKTILVFSTVVRLNPRFHYSKYKQYSLPEQPVSIFSMVNRQHTSAVEWCAHSIFRVNLLVFLKSRFL
jgi:hypothetical protein